MPRIALKIEAADGSRTDIPELIDSGTVDGEGNPVMIANPVYDSTWVSIEAGNERGGASVGPDPAHGIPEHYVVLNAAALAKTVNQRAASQAIQDETDSRTVVVTIDDSVMEKTEERFELQTVPGAPEFATVKTRMVAQRGVANPNHVTVETLAEFKARQS
jgi:hypothetical protein